MNAQVDAAPTLPVPACVAFYESVRVGRAADQTTLGVGANRRSPDPAVRVLTMHAVASLFDTGRVGRYVQPTGDPAERDRLAALLDVRAGAGRYGGEDLVCTNGSTEALNLLFSALRHLEHYVAVLPLPAYFAYELSAARAGIEVCGYVSPDDGSVHWLRQVAPDERVALFMNTPESITGSALDEASARAIVEEVVGEEGIVVWDCIYQDQDWPHAEGASAVPFVELGCISDEQVVHLLTASKDLAVPGLRAGMLATRNRAILRLVSAMLMERAFAPAPLPSSLMAISLAASNAHAGHRDGGLLTSWMLGEQGALDDDVRVAIDSICDPARARRRWERARIHDADGLQRLDEWTHGALGVEVTARRPDAGFSTTLELPARFSDGEEMRRLAVDSMRQHRLRVYPHLVFGGDQARWRRVHGHRAFLRVNVSLPLDRLDEDLARLRGALRAHR